MFFLNRLFVLFFFFACLTVKTRAMLNRAEVAQEIDGLHALIIKFEQSSKSGRFQSFNQDFFLKNMTQARDLAQQLAAGAQVCGKTCRAYAEALAKKESVMALVSYYGELMKNKDVSLVATMIKGNLYMKDFEQQAYQLTQMGRFLVCATRSLFCNCDKRRAFLQLKVFVEPAQDQIEEITKLEKLSEQLEICAGKISKDIGEFSSRVDKFIAPQEYDASIFKIVQSEQKFVVNCNQFCRQCSAFAKAADRLGNRLNRVLLAFSNTKDLDLFFVD